MLAVLSNFVIWLQILIALIAVTAGTFLFWRAGKHELLDSGIIFDIVVVGGLGGLVFGRVWDFLVDFEKYNFNLSRLLFFNIFPGIDFYGSLLGFVVLSGIFLKNKKISLLTIFDLACAPIVFAQSIWFFGKWGLSFLERGAVNLIFFYLGFYYLVVFIILKRLFKRKRVEGFFACFYIFAMALAEIGLFWGGNGKVLFGYVPYNLLLGVSLVIVSIIFWYKIARRNAQKDIAKGLAALLLFIMSFRRTIVSTEESGVFAKNILFSPYYLAIQIFLILKFIVREIMGSLADFLVVLGVKKIR